MRAELPTMLPAKLPTKLLVAALALLAAGCASTSDAMEGPEAYSLLGEPLERPTLFPELEERFRERYEAAREYYESAPRAEGAHVWLGRYLAYLGRYREAVAMYTRGLSLHPDSYKLLRHRGHRYITLRRFDLAQRDLLQATILMAGTEDQIEPDGIPNERDDPRSTYHGNVWYHLGLAYYLQGQFQRAAPCFLNCVELARNDDTLTAATYWAVSTLRRLGRGDEAAPFLERIRPEMDVIENQQYHQLLLLARGDRAPEELLERLEEDDVASATLAYGVANWYLTEGDEELAFDLFAEIVEGEAWPAFGHIAAEAELARRAEP